MADDSVDGELNPPAEGEDLSDEELALAAGASGRAACLRSSPRAHARELPRPGQGRRPAGGSRPVCCISLKCRDAGPSIRRRGAAHFLCRTAPVASPTCGPCTYDTPRVYQLEASRALLSKAFTEGAYAEREQDEHETDEAIEEEEVEGGAIEIVAPVSIAGRRYALELDKTDQVLSALLAEFRSQKLAEFAALLLLVPVLLYLLGGRGLAKRHRGAVRAAGTDPLTALGHHRALQEHLSEAVSRARRHDSPLSLALFDVDEFKLVNDRLGHRYGDNVLIEVAGLLAGGRHSDTGFRIGGDEFALVLEGSDLAEARAACERILSAFTERLPEVGLSAGLSELATHGDAESLWEQSDRALYDAKRAGRRRVVALS